MAYKAMALRAPIVTDEFMIGSIRLKTQRNGVRSAVVRATVQRGHATRDINIFANGARLADILPAIQKGEKVRLLGKWSQRNTMVAFGVQTDLSVPLHSPTLT